MDPPQEQAIYNERLVRIVCVGAGASGICLAYKLNRSFSNFELTIFDKNPEVGGTWYENRYPGCACDVPSHNYTFSFDPKPDFSSVYAGSEEIKSYFQGFVAKYDLGRFICPSHVVTRTNWDETKGEWQVDAHNVETGETVRKTCDIVVHATGYLNKPAWPRISGLDDYKGIKLHSANYDESVDLKDRNVLIVGGGSSAVQILPAIQPIVKKATIVIRSPSWMLPDISEETSTFSAEQIEKFVENPQVLLELRQKNERTMNSIFTVYMKNAVLQDQARTLLESTTRKLLDKYERVDKLIPDFPVGCKRVIPSGFKFLKTLGQSNVEVVHSSASSFTSSGIITEDGDQHEAEIVICATGFDTSYVPRYPVLASGRNLQNEWSESIMGYLGIGVSNFPNTFTMLGPYTPVSNGPTLVAIEAQADYICSAIDRYQTESIHSMTLPPKVCEEFKEQVATTMEKLVWTDNCRNSHNNKSIGGRTPTTWPGSTLHYLEAMRQPRWDDWDIQYRGNRFSWMGNGISQTEWEPTTDLAYYIRQQDDGDFLSKKRKALAMARQGSQPVRELHRQAKLGPAEPEKLGAKVPGVVSKAAVPDEVLNVEADDIHMDAQPGQKRQKVQ